VSSSGGSDGNFFPFAHERPACELIGLTRVRDLGLFDQDRDGSAAQ